MEREIIKEKRVRDTDPFAEISKVGNRIENLLASASASLTIDVVGTLHTGHIGNGIRDKILESDLISLELPSVSVVSYLSGQESRIKKGEFWAEVIDFARDNDKVVIGVNNDRDAVDGIRAVEGRFPPDYTHRQDKADISFSSADLKGLLQSEPDAPFTLLVSSEEYTVLGGKDDDLGYPVVVSGQTPAGTVYYHQYSKIDGDNKARAAFSGRQWALPIDVAMEFDEEFVEFEAHYPILEDLRRFGLSHISRLRVDRGQTLGMLSAIEKTLKDQLQEGILGDFKAVHFGGAAHNPNLAVMMDKAFDGGQVSTNVDVDDRIFPLARDHLTFFSDFIDPEQALRATTVHEGEVFVHRDKVKQILMDALRKAGNDRLASYYKREYIVNEFTLLRSRRQRRYYVEDYALAALLEMMPFDQLDELPKVSAWFHYEVAEYLLLHYPEKLNSVARIVKSLQQKETHFVAED